MDKKKLKKLMTRVAKGEISEKEAKRIIDNNKTKNRSKEKVEGKSKRDVPKKKIQHKEVG